MLYLSIFDLLVQSSTYSCIGLTTLTDHLTSFVNFVNISPLNAIGPGECEFSQLTTGAATV